MPDERAHFFEHLKIAAESADANRVDGLLLRRQAHYVARFDESDDTAYGSPRLSGPRSAAQAEPETGHRHGPSSGQDRRP
ncbi:hypothetical protein ACIBG8_26570 [Nonomuraea sp. NPDC050556]|uniref:hypothetical protein n=1 Tax=Nonomuraea sp. NPDC050556 TaxID=3364369 RepID=UPI0037AB20CE